jgi:hypothetical protein
MLATEKRYIQILISQIDRMVAGQIEVIVSNHDFQESMRPEGLPHREAPLQGLVQQKVNSVQLESHPPGIFQAQS